MAQCMINIICYARKHFCIKEVSMKEVNYMLHLLHLLHPDSIR